MRCPSCNKFASNDEQEPELNSEDFTPQYEDGNLVGADVQASVRIVNSSECCGEELTEAEFEMSDALPAEAFEGHTAEGEHELEAEFEAERVSDYKGSGRYTQTFYGAEVTVTVTCSCGGLEPVSTTLRETIKASHMDTLV